MTANWLIPAALVLILDQVSKALALSWSDKGLGSPAGSGPRIRPVNNVNIGFGLIRSQPMLILLWGIASLGTILLINLFSLFQGYVTQIGLGVALGGAASNMSDMLWRGAVVDFIDLRIWPVFNLADTAIVLGIAAALWSIAVAG
jgi:signal peptidase II